MVSKKKTRVVDDVVKNAPLKTKAYEQELRRLHVELVKLQQWVVAKGLKVCIVFEGRDGAGKGGAIKAITERGGAETAEAEENTQTEFKIGSFTFDSKLRNLSNGTEEYKLSPKENALLKLLCQHMGDLMPRELALVRIWKDDNYFTARSMDVYIVKLRKYLKSDPKVSISNIHGEGFRLVVEP